MEWNQQYVCWQNVEAKKNWFLFRRETQKSSGFDHCTPLCQNHAFINVFVFFFSKKKKKKKKYTAYNVSETKQINTKN